MIKIIVISDSHHNYPRLKSIVELNKDADLFIHLGDGMQEAMKIADEYVNLDFAFVRGNCDGINYLDDVVLEVGGYKLFCTHGHNYYVKRSLDTIKKHALSIKCDIVLYGHTHIARVDRHDNLYVINPGSVYDDGSYGIITISEGEPLCVQLSQLQARTQ